MKHIPNILSALRIALSPVLVAMADQPVWLAAFMLLAGITDAIDGLIARFGAGRKLSEADTILLMRSVPDRMHTVIPGLVIASEICGKFASEIVRYSDSGVREGFLYSEVIG